MSRDILLRLIFSLFIFLLIFALHRLITVSPRAELPALSGQQPLIGVRGAALTPVHALPAYADAVASGTSLLVAAPRLGAGDAVMVAAGDGPPLTLAKLYAAFPAGILLLDLAQAPPRLVDSLAGVIAQAGAGDRTLVANAGADSLRQLRGAFPQLGVVAGPRETQFLFLLTRLHLDRFHRPLSDLYLLPAPSGPLAVSSARIIAAAHRFNQKVLYETDDPAQMRGLLDLGADGILTGRPDLALAVFQEIGGR